jgi:hypothetical protein
MVKRTETWEERVRWYAEREWPDRAIETLLAYAFAVDRAAKSLRLRAIFDHAPSDQDKADMWELEGGIGVHFPDDWQVSTWFEIVHPSKGPDLGRDEVLYRRGDGRQAPAHIGGTP